MVVSLAEARPDADSTAAIFARNHCITDALLGYNGASTERRLTSALLAES